MDKFYHVKFMAPECHTHYYNNLSKTKLLRCFAPDPCLENKQWVREFYTNISEVSFSYPLNVIVKIQGKLVKVRAKQINNVYGIKQADMGAFMAKGCK